MAVTSSSRINQADIDRANAVSLADIADERGLVLKKSGADRVGPCPHCGGTDRFSINDSKQVFNCRGCDDGKGRGAISFVMWLDGCGFREVVETLIGERSAPVNQGSHRRLKTVGDANRFKKSAADRKSVV